MALAVFFLLSGTLAAEISLLGVPEVGYGGAMLLFLSAATLTRLWWNGHPESLPSDAPGSSTSGSASASISPART